VKFPTRAGKLGTFSDMPSPFNLAPPEGNLGRPAELIQGIAMSERDMSELQDPPSGDAGKPGREQTHEELLSAKLPPQVTNQPDPALQLSAGRLGGGAITLVAVVTVMILGVVLYGLNAPAPPAAGAGTAGSAPSSSAAPPPR
jgi:hypothetical protein